MNEVYRNSLLCRFVTTLAACYEDCIIHRLFRVIAAIWKESSILKIISVLFSADQTGVNASQLKRWSKNCNAALASLQRLPTMWEESLFYKIWSAFLRCGRQSRLLGWLFKGGMTGFLLLVLALYDPVDVLLRDVLSISLLSSIWDEAFLVFCVAYILRQRMTKSDPIPPKTNCMDMPVILFCGIGLMLLFAVSPYFSIAVAGYRATAQYILWFFVITRLLRNDRDFKQLYTVMVLAATVIALHGIYQYIAAVPIPSNWVDQAETAVRTRVYSIFGSPNIMGDFMVMFAPMSAGLAYNCKTLKGKAFFWICTFCMCFACLFTMSRAAWVAMAVAVLLVTLLYDRKLLLLIAAAAAIGLCLPFVQSRIGYIFTEQFATSTANGGRASRWRIGLQLLQTNPVLGYGLGRFGGAVAMQNQVEDGLNYFYLDNYYLKTLVEMGYLGLAAFLVMMGSMILTGFRAIRRTRDAECGRLQPMCVGMVAGLCGVLVHCYFENIFEEPYMMAYFWMIAGMIVYLGFLREENGTKHDENGKT